MYSVREINQESTANRQMNVNINYHSLFFINCFCFSLSIFAHEIFLETRTWSVLVCTLCNVCIYSAEKKTFVDKIKKNNNHHLVAISMGRPKYHLAAT